MKPNSDITQRLTVNQAAEVLGISAEALRQRIKRNTIPHTKIGNTVYVDVTDQDTTEQRHNVDQTELVQSLQDQVTYLRAQLDQSNDANREMRRLLAALTQRIPELPAAAAESHEDHAQPTSEDQQQNVQPTSKGEQQRSFWQRLFSS